RRILHVQQRHGVVWILKIGPPVVRSAQRSGNRSATCTRVDQVGPFLGGRSGKNPGLTERSPDHRLLTSRPKPRQPERSNACPGQPSSSKSPGGNWSNNLPSPPVTF